MKLFAYEFLTGGGCFSWPASPRPSGELLAEGAAMIDALVRDLLEAEHQVTVLRDSRLPEAAELQHPRLRIMTTSDEDHERQLIQQLAVDSDGVLLIAPESDGALRTRAQWVEQVGGRLMSPQSEWITIAGDKQQCAERLAAAGVPTPSEFVPSTAGAFHGPMMSKPVDGCGSHDLQLVRSADEAKAHLARGRRVEEVHRGWPVSVGVLCGPRGNVPLQPCEQHLNRNLSYYGGRTPLSAPSLNQTAQETARRAVAALGPTQGFVGVDLVFDAPHKAVVVDINPRLTTSYVGLSRYHPRLATTLLQIAGGEEAPTILCADSVIEFTAAGEVTERARGGEP